MRGVKTLVGALLLAVAATAQAGPVGQFINGPWINFLSVSAGDVGTVQGCGADPTVPGDMGACSGVGNVVPADDPPWTFVAPAGGLTLTVVDGGVVGERYEVLDFGISLGFITSEPGNTDETCFDPDVCVTIPEFSFGEFLLAAGPHAIDFIVAPAPNAADDGFFRLDTVVDVPEPAPLSLILATGIVALGLSRRKKVGKD